MSKSFVVTLFSDSNFLGVNILENLLTKNCYVNIVCSDVKKWHENTANLANRSRFSIIEKKDFHSTDFSYAIVISGFIDAEPYEHINNTFKSFHLGHSKNLIIIPFEKYSYENSSRVKLPENIGLVYVGDLLGPRIDLDSSLLVNQLVNSSFYKQQIKVGVGEVLYPAFVSDVAKTITKWLFSFGPYGKESLLLGPEISASVFWKTCESLIPGVKLFYDEKIETRIKPKAEEETIIPCNLKFTLRETYVWLTQNIAHGKPKFFTGKIKGHKTKKNYPVYLKPLVASVLAILLLPIILLIVCAGLFLLSYKQFAAGDDKSAENTLLISKTLSVIAKTESRGLSLIPFVGRVYEEAAFVSGTGESVSNLGVAGIPVARNASAVIQKILGNSIYDPALYSQSLKTGLDDLYQELSFLQADTQNGVSQNLISAKFLNSRIDLEKYKQLMQQGEILAQNLPSLTGKGESKSYLLLFQNNMELRPTGGFIGSFGILTFDGGRITDLAVNDVYSADGQLNGHVEPPAPIKNYLGEANWWLRDSNWDPDFPTSAKRAEWFLDKELGRQVDGVIAIDLDPIKNILKFTGPIFLSDYNLSITSDNLYEKTQSEVQDNFFPGTHKKASFLTALSRNLLSELSKLTSGKQVNLLKTFYADLTNRHVQIFLHDDNSQNAVSELGWSGSVEKPSCGEACYSDLIGEVEANVGVNKANYFVQRSESLSVTVTPSRVTRKLTIDIKNTANPTLGLAGKYKVYLRLLSQPGSQINSIRSISGETSDNLTPEITDEKYRKETGILVEVLGGQSKKVEFSWTDSLSSTPMEYGLYFRKQAGTDADPFSLTVNGKNVYNSNLAGDFFNRFQLQ